MPVSDLPSKNYIREPFFPVVQLKFGGNDFIVTIPPEHLIEFTAIERRGHDTATFVFIDPTFTKIERLLFSIDKERRTKEYQANKKAGIRHVLAYRWGYPGAGLEQTMWKRARLETYTPTITTSGMRLNIGVVSLGCEFALFVEPKTYYGKISQVVETIANEMGFTQYGVDYFIEETDDVQNELSNTEWSAGNRSRVDIVNYLATQARSILAPNLRYTFRLASDGTFHFHTPNFLEDKLTKKYEAMNRKKYRQFKVLFGDPNEGNISFTPTYNAEGISSLAQSLIAATYDPRAKQYQKRMLDRQTLGLTQKNDPKGAKTTAGPLVSDKNATAEDKEKKVNARAFIETRQRALGGRCAGKTTHQYSEPETAMVKAENAFKTLHEKVSTADLELVGIPEYADFSADEYYCDVLVVLPDGSFSEQLLPRSFAEGVPTPSDAAYAGLHWSSGRYIINAVTHTITGSYIINAELQRSTMLEGPQDAKTGAPKKIGSTIVKAT
jgi:hypothetical protein